MNGIRTKQTGFTIVELLIVIVVIGVLAAITVVAYNGIQDRAQNTKRVVAAKDYQKLITSYIVQNGKYPLTVGTSATYCLGTGYPDWNGDGNARDCFATNNVKFVNNTLNSELETIGSLPDFSKTPVQAGSVQNLGLAYRGVNVDGQARATLFYWLKGADQACGIDNLVTVVSGYEHTPTSAKYSDSNASGNFTTCIAALPAPDTL